MALDRQVAVITGTSSGFGYLTALALAERGYCVVGTVRDEESKQRLLREAESRGCGDCLAVLPLDVTDSRQVNDVRDEVKKRYGKVDVLINNAGYSLGGMTELVDMNEWRGQIETNVLGVVGITKAFLPMMRERRKGKIINLGSISGRFGFPGLAPYVTSKHALGGFSESLRLELLPFGIYVSLIEAGSFKTRIWEKGMANVTVEKDYEQYISKLYVNAEKTVEKAADPLDVVKLIERICGAEKPKFRYQVGKGVGLGIWLKSVLPWAVIEWAVKRKMK
ncbi:SDR family oxidoreductase [Alteribacter keqinensis]|uniref:SDR family oxidoreductase n=2 Tax=Alteribacter keqinensis TaxID=2483800 RepID=A0A3M7TXA8_9BACI|nr:SDR family oxidoreductase [Alteribacter keqinensis]